METAEVSAVQSEASAERTGSASVAVRGNLAPDTTHSVGQFSCNPWRKCESNEKEAQQPLVRS